MKILCTGSNGQLGKHFRMLASESSHKWMFTDIEELDITSKEAVERYVRSNDIALIVNCAAYTNVDRAETDDADAAMRINGEAVRNLAECMAAVSGTLIHFSTDYVFGGTRYNVPCTETMVPNPTGVYGRTKLAGEEAAKVCRHLIFRTSWLYSEYGRNFLLTMMRLTAESEEVKVVFDQVGTPTYAGDLAKAVFTLIENGDYLKHEGIFNYANEGVCSWFDFATFIALRAGRTRCRVLPCHSDEFPSPVVRPPYSVLDKTRFKAAFGQTIPHWYDALCRCMDNIERNK